MKPAAEVDSPPQSPALTVISQGGLYEGLSQLEDCCRESRPFVVVNQLVALHLWPDDEFVSRMHNVISRANAVFFVSADNLRLAELQMGRLPNAEVVRNPFLVDYDRCVAFPEVTNFWWLGLVGRLQAFHKGHDLLLSVLADPKWRGRPLGVRFFGDGPNRERLKALATELQLEDRVDFVGQVTDISAAWETCHALILPSRIEGLSLALVEGMLSGRVPIATRVGGAAELIEDESNGFLADAPTVHSLDGALERAWQRRHEWRILGERARQSVMTQVPPDPVGVFADRLIQIASNARVSQAEPSQRS